MLSERLRLKNCARALGISVLLIAVTSGLPTIATAELALTSDGKVLDERTGKDLGSFRRFLELNYGASTLQFDGLDEDFNTVGMMELKIGYSLLGDIAPGIAKLREYYGFGSTFDEGLNGSDGDEDGEIRSELGRFGIGSRFGYGYGDREGAFSLYNQNSINWTKVEPVDYAASSPEAQAVFDRYGDSYHFGALFDGGFKVNMSQSVAVSLGAEGAVLYPRHVFWPWLGSALIYTSVQSALELAGERLIESNPTLGPAIYWVLKTGASLGYYLLVQEDMNWPFSSETPLTMESAKVGLSVGF